MTTFARTKGNSKKASGNSNKSGGKKKKPAKGQDATAEEIPYHDHLQRPTPIFPPYEPALPLPLTNTEKLQVAHALHIRTTIRRSPAYRPLPSSSSSLTCPTASLKSVSRPDISSSTVTDPFKGMPRYSSRYTAAPSTSLLASASTSTSTSAGLRGAGSVVEEVFGGNTAFLPPELRRIVDPVYRASVHKAKVKSKGKGKTNVTGAREGVAKVGIHGHANEEEDDTARGKEGQEGEEDEDGVLGGEESSFEDSDEEAGGDYDAEGYFDGGDEDDAGGGGGWSRGFEDGGGEGSGYFE